MYLLRLLLFEMESWSVGDPSDRLHVLEGQRKVPYIEVYTDLPNVSVSISDALYPMARLYESGNDSKGRTKCCEGHLRKNPTEASRNKYYPLFLD